MYLGVDIGGTFTDLVLLDEDGRLATAKASTTPDDLALGVLSAIGEVARARDEAVEALLGKISVFGHGTTQATNALIERTGARTGLITTAGFGDTIGLQRLLGLSAGVPVDQLGWYSRRRYPEPIIPIALRREVPERIDHAGRILLPLDEEAVRRAVLDLAEDGVNSFAVTLLWSFRNTAHERRIGEIIHSLCPDSYVSLSCDVSPILGEYERTATTALNSYLSVRVANYLGHIESALRERGFGGKFYVLNSAGGVMPAQEAARKPVMLIASGPAGGVLGSQQLAKSLGYRNVITTDMGGTSFDVALIVNEKPLISTAHEAGGYHLNTPMIDIRAIGAGGGSIARVGNGLLRVGPTSAGAQPGPVCYGRGGTLATVTDANLVLGILSAENFLGGRMKLDAAAAREALWTQIAEPLGISLEQAAAGIIRVVNSHMADALREVTVGRGHDPRDFVIFAYGGAGPAHCSGFGAELGVRRIIIPATSMAHSAYGALAADLYQSSEQSLLMRGGGTGQEQWQGFDAAKIGEIFDDLEARCLAAMSKAGMSREQSLLLRTVDMRYRRQTHDLMISFPDGRIDEATIRAVTVRFQDNYEAVYGAGSGVRDAGIEMTTFRVEASGVAKKPLLRWSGAKAVPRPGSRTIYEPELGRSMEVPVWHWLDLPIGHEMPGPAVVEHPETTVYIGPNRIAVLDSIGNLVIDLAGTFA
jgi:N-methylhydantoinase A